MQELVKNPFAPFEDSADPEIPTATLQIYGFINDYLGRKPDTHVNRASSASMCVKRRWFQRRGVIGTPLTPRKSVNFLLGDLSERVMLYFITQACVGHGKLYSEVDFGTKEGEITFQGKTLNIYRQEDLSVEVEGVGKITAHADGFGKRNSDGKWELIECKSSSNYGFRNFRKDADTGDYLKQSMTLMRTGKAEHLGVEQVRFFYLRKETGHLYDAIFDFDPFLWAQVISEFKMAIAEVEPVAPYAPEPEIYYRKPTGRMVLPFPCAGYCPYTDKCHRNYDVEWKGDQHGNQKPTYVVRKDEIQREIAVHR